MCRSLHNNRQLTPFDELSSQLFFNIFINKPDSTIFDFIKKYFPAFTENVEPGGWIMYPPGPPPVLFYTIHSVKFKTHPYFDASFSGGRLDILASEEKEGNAGVTDFQLWFMFDNKSDADLAFKQLTTMFNKVSRQNKITESDGRRRAVFSDQEQMKATNSVELILTADEFYTGKYKLLFRVGAFTYPVE